MKVYLLPHVGLAFASFIEYAASDVEVGDLQQTYQGIRAVEAVNMTSIPTNLPTSQPTLLSSLAPTLHPSVQTVSTSAPSALLTSSVVASYSAAIPDNSQQQEESGIFGMGLSHSEMIGAVLLIATILGLFIHLSMKLILYNRLRTIELLRDRDDRQQQRMMGDMRRGGRDPVDSGSDDWDSLADAKKFGGRWNKRRSDRDEVFDESYIMMDEDENSGRGRRSLEFALDMDLVPSKGMAAWGPNGPVSSDVQSMDAMEEIKRAKKFLEKKEDMVEDAKEEVVALKADATFYEKQLDGVGGSAARTLEKELGSVLRDVEDSQRMLRMARAERDAASRQVENLEARHWALLSEYEATQSFDD